MLEAHGPHLPIGTDTIGVTYEAERASRRVAQALPDWNVVMMPPIPYGQSGANELGGRLTHPGTYAIRQTTLRSLVADLGAEVAQNGFKWIFVLNGHGSATHNIAISEACDFVSETFRVTMLHVTALLRADAAIQANNRKINARYFSPAMLASLGMDLHAGVGETAGTLAIRPDLVDPQFRKLPARVGRSLEELQAVASAPGWQGYLSDPAKATAAYGRAFEAAWIEGFASLILRAVRGENLFVHPRSPDRVPPSVAATAERALQDEAAFAATLEQWLAQRQR
jgi:creatinine amidohydrolase/Fe(II)-dependent formamide hydrolase-like protein